MKKYNIIIIVITLLFINTFVCGQNKSDPVNYPISVTLGQNIISGEYTVWYGNPDNLIKKPFIICEGFDPLNTYDATFAYNQINNGGNLHFLDDLRDRQFDIIILNLESNHIEIENNAELFIHLITEINQQLNNNNSIYRLNVCGISMGGLIIRYALSTMESRGIDHRVANYISFDSPQMGANIPIGIQQMAYTYLGPLIQQNEFNQILDKINMGNPDGLQKRIKDISVKLLGFNIYEFHENIINQANYAAAFEMAAVFYRGLTHPQSNFWRNQYLTKLQLVGSYPKNCRNIAVSMGSNGNRLFASGATLMDLNQGLKILDETFSPPFHLPDVHLQWTPMAFNNSVYATQENANSYVTFLSSVHIQPFVNMPIIPLPTYMSLNTERDYSTAPVNCNLDNAPGSYLNLGFDETRNWLDQTVNIPIRVHLNWTSNGIFGIGHINIHININYNWVGKRSEILGTLNNSTNDEFTFIPTLSALGINSSDWLSSVRSHIPDYPYSNNKSVTPFDVVCYSQGNNFHAQMPSGNDNDVYNTLCNEIIPSHIYVQNRHFNANYSNVFEANNITVGKNVDPISVRTSPGDVFSDEGCKINFKVPLDGSISLKDGCSLKGNLKIYRDANFPNPSIKKSDVIDNKPAKDSIPITNGFPTNKSSLSSTVTTEITITDSQLSDSGLSKNSTNIGISVSQTKIDIYPNPISDKGVLYIELPEQTKIKADILTIQGKILNNIVNEDFHSGINIVEFNVENLTKGIYLCNIYYNNEFKTIKLIVL